MILNTPSSIPVVRSVVIVDPAFDAYRDAAASIRGAGIDLHLRSGGADALRLAARRTVDVWIVAQDLDDMSGADFVSLLRGRHASAADVRVLTGPDACADLADLIAAPAGAAASSSGLLASLFSLPAAGIGLASALIIVALQGG